MPRASRVILAPPLLSKDLRRCGSNRSATPDLSAALFAVPNKLERMIVSQSASSALGVERVS